jgi:hypothetical protein
VKLNPEFIKRKSEELWAVFSVPFGGFGLRCCLFSTLTLSVAKKKIKMEKENLLKYFFWWGKFLIILCTLNVLNEHNCFLRILGGKWGNLA